MIEETTQPRLVDVLRDHADRLIAGVEAAVRVTTTAAIAGRTVERVSLVMRGLVERLSCDRPERATPPTGPQYDVAPLVAALRLLEDAVYALADEREVAVSPREARVIGEWFAAAAETALLAENARFSEMLDALPDHVILHDADGCITYANRALADASRSLAGVSRAELLGRRTIDIVPKGPFGEYIEQCLERVRRGESITEEFLFPRPDGAHWHEHHLRPVYGPDGALEAIAVASRNIHERRKAQVRLQLMSRLGALAETMEHEGILDAIAHLSIPELADCCLINVVEHGRSPRATIVHRDAAKAVLARDLLRTPSQLPELRVGRAALAGEPTLLVDIETADEHDDLIRTEVVQRLDVRSAIVMPIVVMGAPVAIATFMMTPESGRRYGDDDLALAGEMAKRAAQIIENARLHQELRQSEARFRIALEHANISVFETDRELRLTWGHGPLLGESADRSGRALSEVLGVDGEREPLDRVIVTGEGTSRAFHAIRDGKRRHLLVRYEARRGAGGIVGLTGAIVDVTELKEAEEQVARELAFRERMMGILGHDLRNPVSAVLGLAGLMRLETGLSDRGREQLTLIERSARRMNEMIGTLLDFTRLRFHGSLPIAAVDLDLEELLRAGVAELQAAHRDRALVVSTKGDLRGRWDPGRIAQLLSNLVVNALSHGASESPVWVDLDGELDVVVLSVSNHGPTIPAAAIAYLFEPFRQGEGEKRGLGLGLFITREIAVAHGGAISVRSADEHTTFSVRLPRATPAAVVA